ncbi:MAG: hypothetical protein QG567_473 [Campylobacterota bacterium]|nr:hypothetical protein [Campylobacterota bacterium]
MSIDKSMFNFGDCPEFADVLFEELKSVLPDVKIALVRGLIKLDDYEKDGDVEWQDCHVVVMLNDRYFFDVDGLSEFDKVINTFGFHSEPLKIEMLDFDKISREEYSIYQEYDGTDGHKFLEKSIYANFLKLDENGDLDIEAIDEAKNEAREYIKENRDFFNDEIQRAKNLLSIDTMSSDERTSAIEALVKESETPKTSIISL